MIYRGTKRVRPCRVSDGVEYYQCTGECNRWLPKAMFPRLANPNSTCGIGSWCRACANKERRERLTRARAATRAARAAASVHPNGQEVAA